MDLYQQIFFTTLAFAFCMFHSFLYWYDKNKKSNLYFALFLLFYALNIFFDFQASIYSRYAEEMIYIRIHRAVLPFNPIFMLLFLYSIFNFKKPWHFKVIAAGLIFSGFAAVVEPIRNFGFIQIFFIVTALETTRIFVRAFKEIKEGAKILTFGFMILFIASSYDLMMDVGLIYAYNNIHNGYPFGFLVLMISISAYLARDFSRMNKKIIEQEINQKMLQAEDARKSKELEEARQIQLSMLPACQPNYKNLDICFDMRTATEVGGDYYDYFVSEDDSIIFAIGDATGHGTKAGLMVSIIKSLFITHISHLDLLGFLNLASSTIRDMNLNNLYMSLMLVKIENNKLIVAAAGMPPLYIYRAETKVVEELVLKSMPLGAVKKFPYTTTDTILQKNDTALLMSDGLAELFNANDEMFDEFRIKEEFKKIAHLPANQISARLFQAADEWRKDTPQKDDITFVVFKSV